jgi:mono/diheme cytochrome c family protein
VAGLALGTVAAEERALPGHVDQADIDAGKWSFEQLREAGKRLFQAKFTILDGATRPGQTHLDNPTGRVAGSAPTFLRSVGPDANSCSGCHGQPHVGGAGDFAANVFVPTTARELDPFSIAPEAGAERHTPGMDGSGAIEMLAREMTRDLISIREQAVKAARETGAPARRELVTKGVSFGFITALPDGTGLPDGNLRFNEVTGVDRDLIVRPWNQKGQIPSLRAFSVNALNRHHGMGPVERFGIRITGTRNFDESGVADKISVGDVTAITVWQASLPVPGRVMPKEPARRAAVAVGEAKFAEVKCASCHVPALVLNDPVFSEPGPYNDEGTMRAQETTHFVRFDLTRDTPSPRLERLSDGRAVVRAYTDLKRHRICDREKPHFCNEHLVRDAPPPDQFITKRLWGVGNTMPYGHRGDLTTLREAILNHGGDARESRIAFEHLAAADQDAVIVFLETLQVLPEGSPSVIEETPAPPLPYARAGAD